MRPSDIDEFSLAQPRGIRRFVIPLQRWLVRLLRPIFQRQTTAFQVLDQQIEGLRSELECLTPLIAQVAHFRSELGQLDFLSTELQQIRNEIHRLCSALDRIHTQVQADVALGCDRTAIVRRLAMLEDHVETLLQQAAGGEADFGKRRPRAA